jgi:hypothetical protein
MDGKCAKDGFIQLEAVARAEHYVTEATLKQSDLSALVACVPEGASILTSILASSGSNAFICHITIING